MPPLTLDKQSRYYLPHSTTCFICGAKNEVGLKCRFYADDRGAVHLEPIISRKYAGFADVIHGGIQTAILDEAMGWCGFTQTETRELFFTRELNVKFKRNAPPLTPLFLEASLTDVRRGFYHSQAKILDESGALLTLASGIFVPIPKAMMAQVNNQLLFIDDGRRYLPKAMQVCKPRGSVD
ncbi:MAG: PaaI family thioesterase [Deferribacteraceae bacterium]|nr:PaaI family thioesterase [Deferribacteraceae bacterium]